MKVDIDTIFGKKLNEPMFCKEQDDFPLMVMQISKALWANQDDTPDEFFAFLTMSIKIICHEYLASVLSGRIEPYEFDTDFKEHEYESFRNTILSAKESIIKAGAPMKEVDGKYVLDTEELMKGVRRKYGKA